MEDFSLVLFGLIFVGLVIVSTLFRKNKNNDRQSNYDERQLIVQGKGYKYGFFTVCILEVINYFFYIGEIKSSIDPEVIALLIVLFGAMVHTVYCIINDAYLKRYEDKKIALWIFLFVGLIDIINSIRNLIIGELFTDYAMLTFVAGLFFLIVPVSVFIRTQKLKIEEDEDDM